MSELAVESVTLSAASIVPNSSSSNAPGDAWKQLPPGALDAWHHAVQLAKALQGAGWQLVSPNPRPAEADATAQAPHSSANSEAFEVAAHRMRQAVRPVGGREEGAISAWIDRHGDAFRVQVVDMLRHPEYFIGPGELGAPLIGAFKFRLGTVGPVALGGVRSGEKAALKGTKEITKAAEGAIVKAQVPTENSLIGPQQSAARLTKAEAIFARDATYKPKSNTAVGRRIIAEAPPNVRGYRVFAEFLGDVAYGKLKIADPALVVPDNVAAYQDVQFATINGRDLKLDLFVPKTRSKRAPLVVLIHGGCWISGTRKNYGRQAIDLARRGYAAASIDYRLSEEAAYPAAVDDCRASIQWLGNHADDYGLDRTRIALLGGSAGGHLAEYVGYRTQTMGSDVRAVVSYYGWSDLTHPTVRDFYWNEVFLGKKYEDAPDLYREASPITHVGRSSPPTLLLHGTIDPIVPPNQSVMLVEKLEEHSVPYVYAPFLGLYHAFAIDEGASERAMYFVDRFLTEYLVT